MTIGIIQLITKGSNKKIYTLNSFKKVYIQYSKFIKHEEIEIFPDIPNDGYYYYSFALHPEKYQPIMKNSNQ